MIGPLSQRKAVQRLSGTGGPKPRLLTPFSIATDSDLTAGARLSITGGTWGNGPLTSAYQWKRSGVVIVGATNSFVDVTSSDGGAIFTCEASATNANGTTKVVSNQLGPFTVPLSSFDPAYLNGPMTLSNSNRTIRQYDTQGSSIIVGGRKSSTAGKVAATITVDQLTSNRFAFGVIESGPNTSGMYTQPFALRGSNAIGFAYNRATKKDTYIDYYNGSLPFKQGDKLTVAFNGSSGILDLYLNGSIYASENIIAQYGNQNWFLGWGSNTVNDQGTLITDFLPPGYHVWMP